MWVAGEAQRQRRRQGGRLCRGVTAWRGTLRQKSPSCPSSSCPMFFLFKALLFLASYLFLLTSFPCVSFAVGVSPPKAGGSSALSSVAAVEKMGSSENLGKIENQARPGHRTKGEGGCSGKG